MSTVSIAQTLRSLSSKMYGERIEARRLNHPWCGNCKVRSLQRLFVSAIRTFACAYVKVFSCYLHIGTHFRFQNTPYFMKYPPTKTHMYAIHTWWREVGFSLYPEKFDIICLLPDQIRQWTQKVSKKENNIIKTKWIEIHVLFSICITLQKWYSILWLWIRLGWIKFSGQIQEVWFVTRSIHYYSWNSTTSKCLKHLNY